MSTLEWFVWDSRRYSFKPDPQVRQKRYSTLGEILWLKSVGAMGRSVAQQLPWPFRPLGNLLLFKGSFFKFWTGGCWERCKSRKCAGVQVKNLDFCLWLFWQHALDARFINGDYFLAGVDLGRTRACLRSHKTETKILIRFPCFSKRSKYFVRACAHVLCSVQCFYSDRLHAIQLRVRREFCHQNAMQV